MNENDEHDVRWLRDAFAARPTTDSASDGERIEPGRLWDAAGGESDGEDVAALADRIAEDPTLAEEYRLALAAREAMARAEKADEQAASPRSMGWGWLVTAAAAVVLVWAVMPNRDGTIDPETPQVRGGADDGSWGAQVESRTLRWNAVPEASGYRVLVFGPDMTPLVETPLRPTPTAGVPESIRGPVFWQVEATLSSGETKRSPLFEAQFD